MPKMNFKKTAGALAMLMMALVLFVGCAAGSNTATTTDTSVSDSFTKKFDGKKDYPINVPGGQPVKFTVNMDRQGGNLKVAILGNGKEEYTVEDKATSEHVMTKAAKAGEKFSVRVYGENFKGSFSVQWQPQP